MVAAIASPGTLPSRSAADQADLRIKLDILAVGDITDLEIEQLRNELQSSGAVGIDQLERMSPKPAAHGGPPLSPLVLEVKFVGSTEPDKFKAIVDRLQRVPWWSVECEKQRAA